MLNEKASINKLRWIMASLRDPKTGCPWDLKQTFESVVSHTLEEAYEVADAIEKQDYAELTTELGDLLFQVVFYSQLGEEEKRFNFDDVVDAICEKLIRRHPHVFSDVSLLTDADIKTNWENEKIKEREQKNGVHNQQGELSILADIPKNLPALSQAAKIQKRCSHVGFDWDNVDDVFDKIVEEVQEVKEELHTNQEALGEELGDLMFAVVNLCRHAKKDPETLLRQANKKFTKRFQSVEHKVNQSSKAFTEHNSEELESFWQEVKQEEK